VNAMNTHTLMPPAIPPHPLLPHDRWVASFPLRSFMEYGAYNTASASARGHVRNVLEEWRLGAFEEKASLVTSELLTNSVAATGKRAWEAGLPPVRLWVLAGPDGVLVAVWDAVTVMPERRDAGDLDESGRGLGMIVDCLCARWDSYLPPAPHGGKVIRALITSPVVTFPETARV
jgi:anti-sigma regulatory factor (Ser/Thr protein kinase)